MRAAPSAFLLWAVLIGVAALPLRAQDVPKPANLADARAQFDAADEELNRVYRQCVSPERSTVQSIAHLKQAQQLWVQYRDENAAAYQTGQSSRAVTKDEYYYYAAAVITRSRIKELRLLFAEP